MHHRAVVRGGSVPLHLLAASVFDSRLAWGRPDRTPASQVSGACLRVRLYARGCAVCPGGA
jgi:hypothetical protein